MLPPKTLPLQSLSSNLLKSEQSFNSLHERFVETSYEKFKGALNAALNLAYIKAQKQELCSDNEECLMFVLDEYHKKINEFFESVTQKSNE